MINQYCNDCFYDFDWKKHHIYYKSIEQDKKVILKIIKMNLINQEMLV